MGRTSHYGFLAAYRSPEQQASRDGLPEQILQRRQKLGHKAQQEPQFRFYTLDGAAPPELGLVYRLGFGTSEPRV